MRILITTPIFPPEIGGPATYTWEFCRRLRQKHEISVITLTPDPKQLEGVRVISVPRTSILRNMRLFLSIIKNTFKADILYAQNPTAMGLPSLISSKLFGKPVVVKFVGDTAWEKAYREGKTKKTLEQFLTDPDSHHNILRIERFVLKHASHIITPSKYLMYILTRYHKIPRGKITVIPNAVEVPELRVRRKNAIITIARLVPWKGVHELISVMPEIRQKTGAELWIVGEGPEKKKLEKMASGMEGVKFFGSLPHIQVLRMLASSRCMVLNSLYEGMPHILLEAMALGTPIVATDIPGNSEIVQNEKSGFLIPPRNQEKLKQALLSVLSGSMTKMGKMRLEEKKIADRHKWETALDKAISLFSHLLSNPNHHHMADTPNPIRN